MFSKSSWSSHTKSFSERYEHVNSEALVESRDRVKDKFEQELLTGIVPAKIGCDGPKEASNPSLM